MRTKPKIPIQTDSPSARIDQRIAEGSPLAGLAEELVATNPDLTLADLVIEDVRDARQSLIDAMKTADRFGATVAHRLVGHRVIELDDLLDQLRRAPEGEVSR